MHRTNIPRRGVAMLLVLISLAVATIATSAYLASRDNSAIIGDNIVASSSARSAAISGLELGVAILETESDWRTSHTDGRLLDDYPIDEGELDIDLVDMVTGMPPTEETTVVQMTATARVRAIRQSAVAVATILGGAGDRTIDPDLSEFGVFARDKLRMEDDATIARWTASPLAGLGDAINIGTQASVAGTIELVGNAAAIDTIVFTGPSPSVSLVQNASGPPIRVQSLLDTIPMPNPPAPPHAAPTGSEPSVDVNGSKSTIAAGPVYSADSMRVTSGGELTLSGDIDVVCSSLLVESGSSLLIDGNVNLMVYGNLGIHGGSSIELLPGAKLRLFVEDALVVNDSYIGDGPFNPATDLDTTGKARWMDAERAMIYSMPTTTSSSLWSITGASVVKACLYAKNLKCFEIRNSSAFYGNVVANEVRLLEYGAIFYDHTLDTGAGYTRSDSLCFDDFDHILADLLSLASLDDRDLQSVADATDLTVTTDSRTVVSINATSEPAPEPEPGGEITPRPIRVDYAVQSIGNDVQAWEAGT